MHYFVSASNKRGAMQLLSDKPITNWTYVPWGNSYERQRILHGLTLERDQLVGYYTNEEIGKLTSK